MTRNFLAKASIFSLLLLGQGALAMVQSAVDKQDIMDRITNLTLNPNGTLSDQQLVQDIANFSQGGVNPTILNIYVTFSVNPLKELIASREQQDQSLLTAWKQNTQYLITAFLKKLVELKEARETGQS